MHGWITTFCDSNHDLLGVVNLSPSSCVSWMHACLSDRVRWNWGRRLRASGMRGRRINGLLGLSLNDRMILFLVILLDKTVSVAWDSICIRTLAWMKNGRPTFGYGNRRPQFPTAAFVCMPQVSYVVVAPSCICQVLNPRPEIQPLKEILAKEIFLIKFESSSRSINVGTGYQRRSERSERSLR